jgi:hypothetical protein
MLDDRGNSYSRSSGTKSGGEEDRSRSKTGICKRQEDKERQGKARQDKGGTRQVKARIAGVGIDVM